VRPLLPWTLAGVVIGYVLVWWAGTGPGRSGIAIASTFSQGSSQARDWAARALALNPSRRDARRALGHYLLDRGQLQTARTLLADLPWFEEDRIMASAIDGPAPELDPRLASATHRNATAVRAFRLLEANDLVQAEQIADVARAEAGAGLGRLEFLAAELWGAGSRKEWVRKICNMLAFADDRKSWPLIAGAAASPAGAAMMDRLLNDARRDGWNGQLVMIGRALWLSRSGDSAGAIQALEASPAAAQRPENAPEVTEILARPIWYQLLGITASAPRSALEPGDEKCRNYLKALSAGDLHQAIANAAQAYENDPGSWIWGLTLLWDAVYAADLGTTSAMLQSLTYRARFRCTGLWAIREAQRTAVR
jgi:hypothetical protein